MKNKDRNKETYSHQKTIRDGLIIFKRGKSPFWYVRIYLPIEKKHIVRSTKETNRLDAIEVATEVANKMNKENRISVPQNITFKHFADILMEEQKSVSGKTRSKSYAKDDEKIITRKSDGLITHFGKKPIGDITTYHIREYLNLLDKNRESGLSASSKSKHLNILSKIFKVAYEHQVIGRIPLSPKVSKEDKPRPSFTEKEYKNFLKTTREIVEKKVEVRGVSLTQEMYLFIVFMTDTFLRPVVSEVFSIKHRDVEVVDAPKHLRLRLKKGKTGFRYVSSMQNAVDYYKKLFEFNTPFTKEDDYIFQPTYRNRTSAMRNMQRQFNYILDKSNLKKTNDGQMRSPYSLRHYALQIRLLKSKGKVNIFTLAKNAGTSVNQLERFYLKNLQLDDEVVKNLQTF